MFNEDTVEYSTVNISIAECSSVKEEVKEEIIETEDPLLVSVQPGYYYYFICSLISSCI